MGRPSVNEERREQILIAAEKCIAKYGVAGMTLGKLADEATIARPLVRHHAGNREQIINDVVDRFFDTSRRTLSALLASVPTNDPLIWLIEMLFNEKYSNPHMVLLAEALIAEAGRDKKLAKLMHHWLENFTREITGVVKAQFRSGTKAQVEATACGIVGIYFTVDSISPMGEAKIFRKRSREAALMLVDQLRYLTESAN